jgi:hypothetical protein
MLAAAAGVLFTDHATAAGAARAPVYRAGHGHLPRIEQLAAAFVMAGPGVPSGVKLETAPMLSLAPTVARLLRVELPAAEAPPLLEALDDRLHHG